MNALAIAASMSICLLASNGVAAQPEPAAKKEAEARFEEGTEAYAAGRPDEARLKYAQAWAVLKKPNVLFNLARSEQVTGHNLESARHYRAYLRMNDPKITAAERQEAERRLMELHQKLGRIRVAAPKGATIMVDGERVDEADLEIEVDTQSTHKVTATWSGRVKESSAAPVAGSVATVAFSFDDARDTTEPPVPSTAGKSVWPIVGWSLVGAGVITTSVGLGFVFSSNSAANDQARLERDPATINCKGASTTACKDLSAADDARISRANTARVLLGTGGAVLIGGLVILLVDPGRRSTASGRPIVAPLIASDVAGISATGRF